jgi:hypothetical protein
MCLAVQSSDLQREPPTRAASLFSTKKRFSIPQWTLLGIAIALLALHFALPVLVRDYLNDKLADMGDYRGHITDVDLAWWRGA